MPHLTLEYTSNLREKRPDAGLLLHLHHVLESVAGVRIDNCKSRWREVDQWAVGAGEGEAAFVHLDIRVYEGRPEDVRRAVGATALDVLKRHFLPAPAGVALQITVEVLEIRKALYFKDPAPPAPAPAPRQA